MARTYWIRGRLLASEGEPLDAHTARIVIQGNAEAAYEEASHDECTVFPAPIEVTGLAGIGDWIPGSHPVHFRRDRDGRGRALTMELLADGGVAGAVYRAYFTENYREPELDNDEFVSFTLASGASMGWTGSQVLTPPSAWNPMKLIRPTSTEQGIFRVGYMTVFGIASGGGGTAPKIAGWRICETIST